MFRHTHVQDELRDPKNHRKNPELLVAEHIQNRPLVAKQNRHHGSLPKYALHSMHQGIRSKCF